MLNRFHAAPWSECIYNDRENKLRTSLQLRPGQDKAEQYDKNNNTELHVNKHTVNYTIEKYM